MVKYLIPLLTLGLFLTMAVFMTMADINDPAFPFDDCLTYQDGFECSRTCARGEEVGEKWFGNCTTSFGHSVCKCDGKTLDFILGCSPELNANCVLACTTLPSSNGLTHLPFYCQSPAGKGFCICAPSL